MNKIYKVIWNKTRNCYVVVSELAKRNVKGSGSRSVRMKFARILGTLLVSAYVVGGYNVPVASAEGELHYYSVKSESTGDNSNYNNNGATGTDAIAIGPAAAATTEKSIAIGYGASASDESNWGYSIAIGSGASATGSYAIALGNGANASVSGSLPAGVTIAIGDNATVSGDYGIAIGGSANVSKEFSVAIGYLAKATDQYGTSIGNNAAVNSTYGTALGSGAEVKAEAGVAIGYNSVADRAAGVAGYDPSTKTSSVKTTLAWMSTAGAVSVGDPSKNYTRQITGVAAGSEDTDAVNVAQLKAAVGAGGGGATYTAGDGISIDKENNNAISVNNGAGLIIDSDNKLAINTGDGLSVTDNKVKVNVGDGLEFDSGALKVKSGEIVSDAEGFAKAAAVYTEVRPSDGNYVKKAFSAATNMAILDTQLKQTTDALKTEATDRKTAISNEAVDRESADIALSDRIGTLDTDGNYIKSDNSVTKNLTALDTAVTGKADKATTLEGYGITDAYTKDETNNTITTAVAKKADRATTLAGYGITDAYTQAQTNSAISTAVEGKADKATSLAGYGITDAYTRTEADNTFLTQASIENKADRATTLAGYGITDAYTRSETNSAITTAVAKKADRATTLAGYGITDAYTKDETNSTITTAVAKKADQATTLAGYGIGDAYTKTETDGTFATKATVDNKADKATTLAGYGITNAYTKTETTSAINEAITVKADKATTLAGYGITNAYNKTEADAAFTALSDRIGTITEDGIIIEAGKKVSENLTKIDTALKSSMGQVQELFDTKANVDASNVGITAENRAAWGTKLGAGTVKSGDSSLVTGGVVYSEVRPADGIFIKQGNTTAQNLSALDTTLGEVKTTADQTKSDLQLIAHATGIALDEIDDIADEINRRTQDIEAIKNMDGVIAPTGFSKADEFVRGATVYNEVRPADGAYVKKDNTTAENLTALDNQVKTNADNIELKANAADVYTKTAADGRFAQKADTLQGYGITNAYTKKEVDNAIGEKADKATTLQGYGIADAYTKTEVDNVIGGKADKATTLQGYGIADAYTKTEVDNVIGGKADKATTLQGYGITDAYTKTEADDKFLTQASIDNKADKASTLAGYGITDAYTKAETATAIDSAVANKADKATTLEGYGIKDAYTKTATDEAISSAVSGKADKATTLQGYGITDAYTKTEADNKYLTQASIDNKADKATTLSGYGITDAYTKEDTISAISTAVANKANKATTLEGYGITDAYTKTETDIALNNRIGTISKDGLVIKADKNVSENLTLIDNAIQNQAGIAKDILDKKADADASNVGKNAKAGDGSSADNSAAWGSALGTGAVESGNGKLVTGATVYNEVRTESDGEYVKTANTAGANLTALDTQMKANTTQIAVTQKDVEGAIGAINYLATVIGAAEELDYDKIVDIDEKMKDMQTATQHISADENGTVINGTTNVSSLKVNGTDVTDALTTEGAVAEENNGFVKGDTVYEYLNQDSLKLGTNSTKIAIGNGSSAGTDSVSIGEGNSTNGAGQSTAIGYKNTVSGDQSVALGDSNTVSGTQSIAIGHGHMVTGDHSGAFGDPAEISGNYDFSVGNNNKISGNNSVAVGNDNIIGGNNTFVLGSNVNTNVSNAVVLGDGSVGVDNAVSVGAPGNERQIKNVAPGTEATDVATMGQVYSVAQNVNKVDSRLNKVGAGAAALAALHPIEMDNKFGMGLGYGNYRNANAMALGLFYRPKDNLMFSIGGSMGNGENMINAGISIALDKGFTSSKAMMARTIKAQGEALEEQRKANAEQETKIHNLEAENAAIKEQNARLEARLAAIEARLGK